MKELMKAIGGIFFAAMLAFGALTVGASTASAEQVKNTVPGNGGQLHWVRSGVGFNKDMHCVTLMFFKSGQDPVPMSGTQCDRALHGRVITGVATSLAGSLPIADAMRAVGPDTVNINNSNSQAQGQLQGQAQGQRVSNRNTNLNANMKPRRHKTGSDLR